MKKAIRIIALVLGLGLLVTACDNTSSGIKQDQKKSTEALERLQKVHPTPTFDRSQKRQNLIEVETAQANGVATTSFFFLEGIGMVAQCPSIGFPIPSTEQLTNPELKVREHDLTLPQVDPTGTYTGNSSGTYVICTDQSGDGYIRYWEGYVQTVSGPAIWKDGQVVLVGGSSQKITVKK